MGIFAPILMGLAEQDADNKNHLHRRHLPESTSYGLRPAAEKGADWFRETHVDEGITPYILGRKSRKKTVKYDKRR